MIVKYILTIQFLHILPFGIDCEKCLEEMNIAPCASTQSKEMMRYKCTTAHCYGSKSVREASRLKIPR